MKKGYHPAKSEAELKKVEQLVNGLTPQQKTERDKSIADGLNDDVCEKCEDIHLACFHFINCRDDSCPMKNGMSLIDMVLAAIPEEDEQ